MAELAHSHSETTTISSLIGTTYTTVHTHASSNFVAGGKYLIRVKAKLFGELVTGLVQIKVRHGTTDFADSEMLVIPATASGGADFPHPYCWFEVWTAVSGEDITVQIRGSGANGEAQVDQVEFVALRLDSLTEDVDYWYDDVATDTALSVAGINGATISLTPPAGTDLWVMTFGRVDIGSITTSAGSRIVSTGTINESRPSSAKEGDDATNEIWVCDHERVFINLGNTAQTFTEQSYVESGPTGNVLHSRIFALRLNVFKNRAVAWTAAAEVLATTAWGDAFQTGVTYTPDVTGDSWISVGGVFDAGAALREVLHRLQIDNTDQPPTQTADTYDEAWALDADNEIAFGTQTVEALTGSTQVTLDWEGHTNSTTGGPQVVDRSLVIFSFELAAAAGAEMAASVTAAVSVAGALTTEIRLAAAVTAAATVAATLATEIRLAGAVTASATVAGAITTEITMAAAISGTATVAADLTAPQQILLEAAITAAATTAGALTTEITMAGAITAAASVAGTLTTEIRLAAVASATATVAGSLTTEITMASSVTATAVVAGDLTLPGQLLLEAAVTGTATAAGALTTEIRLAAAITGTAAASAALTTEIRLAGAITATATTAGTLTTEVTLAGLATATAGVAGNLTTEIRLAASITATATVDGALGEPTAVGRGPYAVAVGGTLQAAVVAGLHVIVRGPPLSVEV